MQQDQDTILERLGKALHVYVDDITPEPLPRRWIDLIHHLDEQERRSSQDHRPEARRSVQMPLDTWMVVEPLTRDQLKPVSSHTTQEEAEAERDRRNAELGRRRYSACKVLEPIAARVN